MARVTAYVNIGSNLGDRQGNIHAALRLLSGVDGLTVEQVSAPVESEPWGFESAHPFLNQGVRLSTTLDPLHLLGVLLGTQQTISPAPHRHADGSYADRAIDIDLIAMEGEVCHSPYLDLPHPRAHRRDFVMEPLLETLSPAPDIDGRDAR